MANSLNLKLPKSSSDLYNDLYWISVKLNKSSSSIGFIKQCLYLNVIPKCAVLREQLKVKDMKVMKVQDLHPNETC